MNYRARDITRIGATLALTGLLQAITLPAHANTNRPPGLVVPRPVEKKEVGPLLPDLVITRFVVTSVSTNGVEWEYTVKNAGLIAIPLAKVDLQMYFGATAPTANANATSTAGGGISAGVKGELRPGQQIAGRWHGGGYPDLPFRWLVVDKDNLVKETNEKNNFLLAQ